MSKQLVSTRFGALDWALAAALALTWGSSFLLIAIIIEHFDPAVVPFGRALAGAIALAFFPGARMAIPAVNVAGMVNSVFLSSQRWILGSLMFFICENVDCFS